MDYQGKYTGAELEALLDRIGEEPYVEVSFSTDECGTTTTKEVSLAGVDNIPGSGDFYLNVFIGNAPRVFSQARLLCHRDVSGVITSDGVHSLFYKFDDNLTATFISGINEAGTGVIVTSYPRYDLAYLGSNPIISNIGIDVDTYCQRSVLESANAVMVTVQDGTSSGTNPPFLCNLYCVPSLESGGIITVEGRTTAYIDGKGLVEVSASYDNESENIVVSSRYVNAGGQPQAPDPYARVTMTFNEMYDGIPKEVLFSDIDNIPESGDFFLDIFVASGSMDVIHSRLSCHNDGAGVITVESSSASYYRDDIRCHLSFILGLNDAGTGISVVGRGSIVVGFGDVTFPSAFIGEDRKIDYIESHWRDCETVIISIEIDVQDVFVTTQLVVNVSGDQLKGQQLLSVDNGIAEFSAYYDDVEDYVYIRSKWITGAATGS